MLDLRQPHQTRQHPARHGQARQRLLQGAEPGLGQVEVHAVQAQAGTHLITQV